MRALCATGIWSPVPWRHVDRMQMLYPLDHRLPTTRTRPSTGTWRSYNRDQTIFQLDYKENKTCFRACQKHNVFKAGPSWWNRLGGGTWSRKGWEPLRYTMTPPNTMPHESFSKFILRQRFPSRFLLDFRKTLCKCGAVLAKIENLVK